MTRILVSHEPRFVWIAVAKVASMVMHDAITKKLGIAFNDWHACSVPSTAEVAGMNDYFRFGFVRDPWARLFSCYRDKIVGPTVRDQPFILGRFGLVPGMPFADFVRRVAEIPDEQADGHFVSQFFALSFQGQPVVDYIGRFENLPADWDHVRQRFGLDPLPWAPVGSARPRLDFQWHRSCYTPELVALVRERYAADIQHFGYDFRDES
ncbi:MAG: sulfotransferase family protein [Planctomycetes bacterium]|nr:sulfotransferase family protein [Planctomycetota bacterium]